MATLHIEHPVSDYPTWKRAFDGFSERRSSAGVIAQRICQPRNDERYVVLQLDFDSQRQAEVFLAFLEAEVWPSPDRSPALSGVPRARVLLDAPD